jgi:hypothetical protein
VAGPSKYSSNLMYNSERVGRLKNRFKVERRLGYRDCKRNI